MSENEKISVQDLLDEDTKLCGEFCENMEQVVRSIIEKKTEFKYTFDEYNITARRGNFSVALWVNNKWYGYLSQAEFHDENGYTFIRDRHPSRETMRDFYEQIELPLKIKRGMAKLEREKIAVDRFLGSLEKPVEQSEGAE